MPAEAKTVVHYYYFLLYSIWLNMLRKPIVAAFGRQMLASSQRAPVRAKFGGSPASLWKVSAASSTRLFSTVAVPDAPTSNHHHTPLPGAIASIVYTETDEAPALATYSLYPYISKVRDSAILGIYFFEFCSVLASPYSSYTTTLDAGNLGLSHIFLPKMILSPSLFFCFSSFFF